MGLRRVLALKFQAGEMPIFIPWAAPRAAPTDNNRKQGDCYPIDLA
jgi:hypothetical protein